MDHLGSTRLKTDASGDAVFTRNYEPFGPDYDGSGSEEFKYTGKHEDSSGLYYFGARYYDPEVGRFITEDPILRSFENPQGLNRYIYCRNNPLKYIDPDGNEPITIVVCGYLIKVIGGMLITSSIYIFNEHFFLKRDPTPEGLMASYKEGIILGSTIYVAPKISPIIAASTPLTREQSTELVSTIGSGLSYLATRSQDKPYEYDELLGTMITSYGISYSISYYIGPIPWYEELVMEEGSQTLLFDVWDIIIDDDRKGKKDQYLTSTTQYDIYNSIYYGGGGGHIIRR